MELPPEQLVRLLSLETGNTRRRDSPHTGQRRQAPAAPPKLAAQPPEATPIAPPPMRAYRSRAAAVHAAPRRKKSRLTRWAVMLGALLGITACAWLVWYKAPPIGIQLDSAVPAGAPRSSPVAEQQDSTGRQRHGARTAAGNSLTSSALQPLERNQASEPEAGSDADHRPAPPGSALESERRRLRAEAERRFEERLRRQDGPQPASDVPFGDARGAQSRGREPAAAAAAGALAADGAADESLAEAPLARVGAAVRQIGAGDHPPDVAGALF